MKAVSARIWSTLVAWCLGGLAALASSALHAAPQNGWWWNPAESGRGFFLEVQGPRMFMAGYFYADDGRATWLVSNDAMPHPDSYDGRLLAVSQGQSLLGEYHPPSAPVDAGAVSLRFSDSTHGTLTWPGGTVPIERQDFHHGSTGTFQPRTGWWWNPDESGRGFSIEVQGDHMFIGAYMYDDAGNPTWYVADALMSSPTHFSGPLYRFANGQTMGGLYHTPTPPSAIGTITIDFSATSRATVTLSDDTKSSAKQDRTVAIQTQYAPVVPDHWTGSFDFRNIASPPVQGIVGTYHYAGLGVIWTRDELPDLNGSAAYAITDGVVSVDVDLTSSACTLKGATTVDLRGNQLHVDNDGNYDGSVKKQIYMSVTPTCFGFTQSPEPLVVNLDFKFEGKAANGVMVHHAVIEPVGPGITLIRDWIFLASGY